MSLLTLYLVFVLLPGLAKAGAGMIATGCIGAVICALGGMAYADIKGTGYPLSRLKKWIITSVALIAAGAVFSIAAPSERQVMLLAGGYVATNIEGIDKLPPNIVKAANAYLEKMQEAGK